MVEALTSKWWLLLLRGILAIIVGIFAFTSPQATLVALVVVLGAYAFVAGVLAFFAALSGRGGTRWWALLLEGILGIIAGLLIWNWPITAAVGFVYFFAAWLIIAGAFEIAAGVGLRDVIDNEWLYILGGLVSIAFGVWVFRSPEHGSLGVAFLIGWYFLVFGIIQVMFSLRVRSVHAVVSPAKT